MILHRMLALRRSGIATKVDARSQRRARLPYAAAARLTPMPERRHAAAAALLVSAAALAAPYSPGSQHGNLATHQSTATSLFPSHPGKSPTSPQQFAAIGTLVSQL